MKEERKVQIRNLGIRILENARNELYLSMRFLDMALSQLEYEMSLKTFFVGTDGRKLFFNPRFLAERFEYHKVLVNRGYLHAILHCMFRHMFPVGEREEEIWNAACDVAVEYCIDGLDYPCLNKIQSEFRKEWYQRLESQLKAVTAEGIYHILDSSSLQPQEFIKLQLEFLADDHAFWQGKKEEEKENPNQRQMQKQMSAVMELWEGLSQKTATGLETFSKNIGNETRGLLRAMKIANRKRYDYKEFLRKFATPREVLEVDEDAFDYGYYTYGLSVYGNLPLIESLEYKEVKQIEEFVIALDTSGSCSGGLIKRFLEETVSVLLEKQCFQKRIHVHILQCDNQIQEDILITSLDELEQYQESFTVKGFGGTDFRPVFAHVDKLIQEQKLTNLKGMLYFTDGVGVFPKKRPHYDVAFVFADTDYTEKLVPPWAMKLVIDGGYHGY
ncbi:vWA domain-containing protein [[Clostridium] polysaccharolyticum]|uniref:Predicted metal-dependent peptidase n=1 Tax=[Clostridium] polysaccharolyticum TaxID=29364 RepID=A0A1I0DKS8_9FIRM|nr:VWA-like domain-containing protein [[Clostridium] polysaccharolyticum]SET33109.1 Predicted metal-dependent peptidase [[Clostridium] polysaccharolyticum]